MLGLPDDEAGGCEGDVDLPDLRRIADNLQNDSSIEINSPDGRQVDLFSEIHLNELKKLEKQLEQVTRYYNLKLVVMRSFLIGN